MASEVLRVPEEHLREVITIIRAGIKARKRVTREVREALQEWCDEEEEYLARLGDD